MYINFFFQICTFFAQEFFKQSDAEKMEGLPVTPFMDPNKITKPSSQCSFIGFVLLPLFEALGALLPQLQVSHAHGAAALHAVDRQLCTHTRCEKGKKLICFL